MVVVIVLSALQGSASLGGFRDEAGPAFFCAEKWAPLDRRLSYAMRWHLHILISRHAFKGGIKMYGVFGGYTRWAVVFLIIFVLFFLLVPGYTTTCTTTPVY